MVRMHFLYLKNAVPRTYLEFIVRYKKGLQKKNHHFNHICKHTLIAPFKI